MKEEKEMIKSMLLACQTKEECEKWIANAISDSYNKAENMRTMNQTIQVQNHYQDIGILSRISFYFDKHTQHLPNDKGA